ncbi:MAG: hypothetical protein CMJ94_01065 [Planctomycetes bacterium]|nr:hypothetical protein [Planctomycetota bacterium]
MKVIQFTIPLFVLVSCQTQWDRYDESLYASVFEPSEQTLSRHIQTLEGFASWEVPPPGFCAELGYYLVLAGRESEAAVWLERESALWPESAKVVAALRNLIAEGPAAEESTEEVDA